MDGLFFGPLFSLYFFCITSYLSPLLLPFLPCILSKWTRVPGVVELSAFSLHSTRRILSRVVGIEIIQIETFSIQLIN